jgi:hypothetical protein
VRSDRWAVGVSSVATIGKINIGMTTDTAPLKRGLQSAQSSLASFATGATGIGGKVAAALGVGLSVGGLGMFVKSSLEAADSTDEAAQRMGTTAGELAKLRYAAKLTGTETEALDGSLQKMSMILGKAAMSGKGGATNALTAMGLSAKELVTMDPSAAFQKIVAGFAKIENPAHQAAYAMEVFGRGGMQILNTLRAGPEQVAALAKEGEKLGIAITPDSLKGIAAANDAMDRLGFSVQGLGNTLISRLSPAITTGVDLFTSFVASLSDSSSWVGWFASKVGEGFDFVFKVFRNAGPYFEILKLKAQESFGNIVAIVATLPTNFGRVFAWLGRNWWNLLKDYVSMWKTAAGNLLDNVKILGASIGDRLGSIDWRKAIVQPFVSGFKMVLEKATSFGKAVWAAIQGKDWKSLFSVDLGKAIQPAANTNFEFKPLLSGFKATTEKLPDMLAPVWSDMSGQINEQFNKIESNEDEFKKRLAGNAEPTAGGPSGGPTKDRAKGKEALQLAGLAELGSKEAYTAIVKAQAQGEKNSPAKETAKTAKEQLAAQRRMVALLERQSNNFGVWRMA